MRRDLRRWPNGWPSGMAGRPLLGDRIMISVARQSRATSRGESGVAVCDKRNYVWLAPKNKAEAHAHKRVGLCSHLLPRGSREAQPPQRVDRRSRLRKTRLCCASADPPWVLESEQSEPAARLIRSGRGAFLLCWWLSSRMFGAFVGGFCVKLRGPIRGARLSQSNTLPRLIMTRPPLPKRSRCRLFKTKPACSANRRTM
jgi:hypothetical protein